MSDENMVLDLLLRWEELRDAGQNVSVEELCALQPELVAAVRAGVNRLQKADDMFGGSTEATVQDRTANCAKSPAAPSHRLPQVPGYDIQGVLGRGGMGIVFRARDLALNREVAVKILHLPCAPDSTIAARFVEEAQITGQLQHPGIPAVYQVGTLPDSRPFLAMKLIKGETLDVLLKADTSLNKLGVFEAICQAVGFAHAHKVIHRDLKPSNIMVGSFGEVQVMDWGLAKVLSAGRRAPRTETPEASAAVTRIRSLRDTDAESTKGGSVLGTPSYMSPEQAAGEIDKIDQRSDVFGLGAILCVMLTGKPPFAGSDAESVRLNAVRGKMDEALARLDSCTAEPQLVTLCRRCLAFEPAERPANASDVALEIAQLRQAAEERAQQAALAQARAEVQAKEQRKRRRVWQVAGSVLTAVLLLGIAGTAYGLWRAHERRKEADRQRGLAVSQKDAAEKARSAEAQARTLAMNALRKLTDDVVEQQMARRPGGLTAEDRRFLRDIQKQYEEFAALPGNDVESRSIRAEGHFRVGLMQDNLGQEKDAETSYRLSDALCRQLVSEFPDNREFRFNHARVNHNLGVLLRNTGRDQEAEKDYSNSQEILERLVAECPDNPNYLERLAISQHNLGLLYDESGRRQEANKTLCAAIEIQEQLQVKFPSEAQFSHELARSYGNRGNVRLRLGQPFEAESDYKAGQLICERLAKSAPGNFDFQQYLAVNHARLGDLFSETSRFVDAEIEYNKAEAIFKQQVASFPKLIECRQDLARCQNNFGALLRHIKRKTDAEERYSSAVKIFQALVDEYPKRPELRFELAQSYGNLGTLFAEAKKFDEAGKALSAVIAIRARLADEFKKQPQFRQALANGYSNRGLMYKDMGQLEQSQSDYAAALEIGKKLVSEFSRIPDFHNDIAGTLLNLAGLALKQRDYRTARAYLEEAAPAHLVALKSNSRNPEYQERYWKNLLALTSACAALGDQAAAVKAAIQMRDLGWDSPANAYDAACTLALCIPIVQSEFKTPTAGRDQQAQFYADQSMKMLYDAVAKGYRDAAHMQKDPDLVPLRERADFKKLLTELVSKPTGKDEKK